MATDKTEPRVGLILKIGLFCIVLLMAVHASLTSYFNFALQGEELRKFGEIKHVALINLRAAEKDRLNGGSMPIDKAMEQVSHEGRKNAEPAIAPAQSKDVGPLSGWSKLPLEVPPAMMAASIADAGAPAEPLAVAPDAGPAQHADGGAKAVPPGAPKKKP
jgi:hypothetical protein